MAIFNKQTDNRLGSFAIWSTIIGAAMIYDIRAGAFSFAIFIVWRLHFPEKN